MREWTEDAIEKAENVVYLAVALVLVVLAAVVLGSTAVKLTELPDLGVISTAAEVLDLLLLVFIVVELLYAVRTTLAERELVAEPFLIVGIIASIKEIVVLSVKARELDEEKKAMADFGSSDSGASLGDILGAALSRAQKKDDDDEDK